MKLLKVFSISFFLLLSLFFVSPIFNASAVDTILDTNFYTVGTVGINNAKIISQNNNVFNISFDITNADGAQAGLKYSVSLVKDTKERVILDEYVYPESLNLNTNSLTKKDIIYTSPSNIGGDFTLVVDIKKDNNIVLFSSILGKVKITASHNMVEILPETCSISTSNKNKYTLDKRVTIGMDDNMNLSCTVFNPLKKDIIVNPEYQTYKDTIYGEVVTLDSKVEPILFKQGEKKILTLPLQRSSNPGDYLLKTSFVSDGVSSNSIIIKYFLFPDKSVVTGSIKDISLDKDYYKKGDIVDFFTLWELNIISPILIIDEKTTEELPTENKVDNTDSIYSNLSLNINIVNDDNIDCIEPINTKTEYTYTTLKAKFPVINNCKDPQARVEIKDKNNSVLVGKTYSFKSNDLNVSNEESINSKTFSMKNIIIVLVILVVAGISIYFIKLKNKKGQSVDLHKSNE